MFYKVVPLSSSFMLTSIVGAIISILYVYPRSAPFGFTFFLFFTIMFISSLISMTLAPLDAEFDIKKEKNRKIKS
ncbi:MAG: hypothetical protein KAK00_04805 [Nanoarchaeota archaeon]|nr:hypothetical protein [Nanoarchaeota archaeon]